MNAKEYTKAAEYWNLSLEEILDNDLPDPWKTIEESLQLYFMKDKEAMDGLHSMTEGLIQSVKIEISRICNTIKDPSKCDNAIRASMLAIVSTALLRAFAVGAMSQRTYDEIGKLEALLESN